MAKADFFKKYAGRLSFVALLFILAIFFGLAWFGRNDRSGNSAGVKFDLRVCTDGAEQPDCYPGIFPSPVLVWDCHDGKAQDGNLEYSYNIQIDDQADFSSPEIDSGEYVTSENRFTVSREGLTPGRTYYWRIRGRSQAGVWTDWAAEENPFVTAMLCE
ncbi:hypothetical protein A2303_05330 [Candidatus Falkowbacteria bacterium RIFOXYB2_FULL_47_14]|uniref:Fibronectin type-III domain-containing protein n=1 Tax=Candidatus Falkowbacteria bacterium RIFOXYA2_FULL_47_19 TaxID=1797994 RepID=A0A1F5SEB4_9BACT|nr:MAG: hypothetical protein A2227_08040 [Candidatus Falkowbacteria bacterium RIFOXYA2_FULL_47_19]OGF34373.1 MAG: hypothetical protein A2468_05030 [Candidatus Falkowbacteria bacterium RIFOXYC2_FULL_46_15]OGF43272.1 MAG: hypothetical protein A2303_05330 [Candidatus Falkowbacteria bacterium RIFOXYB2_FULL_47_14]